MNNIDYKKLLELCIYRWLESEGCCWDGSEDDGTNMNGEKTLYAPSASEKIVLRKLVDECEKKYEKACERGQEIYRKSQQ